MWLLKSTCSSRLWAPATIVFIPRQIAFFDTSLHDPPSSKHIQFQTQSKVKLWQPKEIQKMLRTALYKFLKRITHYVLRVSWINLSKLIISQMNRTVALQGRLSHPRRRGMEPERDWNRAKPPPNGSRSNNFMKDSMDRKNSMGRVSQHPGVCHGFFFHLQSQQTCCLSLWMGSQNNKNKIVASGVNLVVKFQDLLQNLKAYSTSCLWNTTSPMLGFHSHLRSVEGLQRGKWGWGKAKKSVSASG